MGNALNINPNIPHRLFGYQDLETEAQPNRDWNSLHLTNRLENKYLNFNLYFDNALRKSHEQHLSGHIHL